MNNILMGCFALGAVLLPAGFTGADEIRLNFSGNLIVPSCELTVENPEQTVKFDGYSKKELMSSGKSTGVPFYIRIKTCALANKINLTFKGQEEPLLSGALAISGAASGIAVGLETSADHPIRINSDTLSYNLSEASREELAFKAYLLKIKDKTIEGGNFSAVANFELAYP